jgi:hypothetical protein
MGLEAVPIYAVVEAKTINDLVKLTNMKTKDGWNFLGGMCHVPNNFCESDSQNYPYCQSMYRLEKPKKEKLPIVPVKKIDTNTFPKAPLPTGRVAIIEQRLKNNKDKQKKYAPPTKNK